MQRKKLRQASVDSSKADSASKDQLAFETTPQNLMDLWGINRGEEGGKSDGITKSLKTTQWGKSQGKI